MEADDLTENETVRSSAFLRTPLRLQKTLPVCSSAGSSVSADFLSSLSLTEMPVSPACRTALRAVLDTELRMSTPFHPQTDEPTSMSEISAAGLQALQLAFEAKPGRKPVIVFTCAGLCHATRPVDTSRSCILASSNLTC